MRNYRTTVVGALLAGLAFLAIYQANGGDLADWKQWCIPFSIAALGYVAKDAGVTGAMKLLLGSLALLTLPSCKNWEDKVGMSGFDLMITTANAAARLKENYDMTRAEVGAAKLRYGPRTAAKNPIQPSVSP